MTSMDAEGSRIRDDVRDSKIQLDIPRKFHQKIGHSASELNRNKGENECHKEECYLSDYITSRIRMKIRFFNGTPDHVVDWADAVEEFFVQMDIPEQLKCKIASYAMEGEAEQWWLQLQLDRLEVGKSKVYLWQEMKYLMFSSFLPTSCLRKIPLQLVSSSLKENNVGKMVDGICHTIEINWTDASNKDLECSDEENKRNEMAEVIKHTKQVGVETGEHPQAEGSMPAKCSINVPTELNGGKQNGISNSELLYAAGEDAFKHTGDLQHLVSNTMVLKCEESCLLNSLDGLDVKSVTANQKIGAEHEDANTISALNIGSQVIYANPSNLKTLIPESLADGLIGKCIFITSRIREELGCASKVDIANDGRSRRQIHLMPSNIDFRVGKMLMLLFDPGGIFHPSRAWITSLLNENLANFVSFDHAQAKQNRCDRNLGVVIQDKSVNRGMLCLNRPLNSWMSFIIMKSESYVPVVVDLGIACRVISLHFPKMIDEMQVFSHFDENGNVKLDCVAIGKQFAPIEISTQVSSWDLDEVDVFLFDPGGCIRSSVNWGFENYSLIMVCCTREVHSLSLQSLSKVHVIPVTFLFDPGGILDHVRARSIGLRNGLLAEHVRNAQTLRRQCIWSSKMAMEVLNNALPCLCEPLDSLLMQVWLLYCLAKIHTKSSLISYDSGRSVYLPDSWSFENSILSCSSTLPGSKIGTMTSDCHDEIDKVYTDWSSNISMGFSYMRVRLKKLAAESIYNSFNSDDYGMQINELPGHLISNFIAHALSRYVDPAEGIRTTESGRRLPCCVVMFDEEKRAQNVVLTLLLSVLDDASLIWEWMGKKMEIGLSKMLLRVESGKMHGTLIHKPCKEVLFLFFSEPWDYTFRLTRGRVIPRKGRNDKHSLCENGQLKETLTLFYKVVNGLDPPRESNSGLGSFKHPVMRNRRRTTRGRVYSFGEGWR